MRCSPCVSGRVWEVRVLRHAVRRHGRFRLLRPRCPPPPAAVEATNAAPSDAELKAAFSKFTVTYDEEAGGWDLSPAGEQASMDKSPAGCTPHMFLQDDSIAFNMILTYVGSKKLDIKTVNVSADDELYTFTCDEEYGGGYDQDLGCWFDLELFQLSDEEVSLLSEWLNAKSVTAVFVGRDGTTQRLCLTKENRTAIQEMVTASQPDALLHRRAVRAHPDQSGKVNAFPESPERLRMLGDFALIFYFFAKKLAKTG